MNRNTGILGAIAITVITIFGFSVRPAVKGTSSTAESGQSSHAPTNGAIPEPSLQNLQSPCREINQRIAEFIPDASNAPPDSCKEDPAKDVGRLKGSHLLQTPGVRYIIATLPDPVHTHFSMLFDRLTEALQQAAQDQGYNYDGSWLPWNDETRTYGSLTDQQKADVLLELQNRQPGVVVFRGAVPPSSAWTSCSADDCVPAPYSQGLIVFVVGENPTGGINLEQFKNAVAWIRSVSPQSVGDDVRILGPYFSGSLPSLAQALAANCLINSSELAIDGSNPAQDGVGNPCNLSSNKPPGVKNAPAAAPAKSLTIFSGSVSSKPGIDWFHKFLEKNSHGRFYSFQENDDVMIDRYCHYLNNLGYDTGKLAIISEDETAYGVFPSTLSRPPVGGTPQPAGDGGPNKWLPHCDNPAEDSAEVHGPLYLYYPRDIAALRSAYEQQSPGGGSSPGGTGLGLTVDLGESPGRQRDTIRSYGGKQTPLSQEATLFGITNLFKAHDIQFIVLRSSNSLDQVFLTRFLSRAYPQGRVILTSADLLFRRSSETAGFRGTMTLTTYPLLTWQQDWTYWQKPESRHSHRAFAEDFVEGLYLATRFLIDVNQEDMRGRAGRLSLQNSSVVVQDYAPPSWLLPEPPTPTDPMATRPPTWLSVIGNEQLWPVAVLDEGTVAGQKGNEGSALTACRQDPPASTASSTLPCVETGAKYQPAKFRGLPLSMFVCCVAILIWCCWHCFCCVFGSHASLFIKRFSTQWRELSIHLSRSLAYFAPVPRWQHKALIFIGCTLMGLMAILVGTMTGVLPLPPRPPLEQPTRDIAYCAVVFCLSWAALVLNYRALLPRNWRHSPRPVGIDVSKKGGPTRSKYTRMDKIRNNKDYIKNRINDRIHAEIKRIKNRIKSRKNAKTNQEATEAEQGFDFFSMLAGGIFFLAAGCILAWTFSVLLTAPLGRANAVFTFWRSVNLFTAVSPLVPLLLLSAGLYGWFWYSLSGLALFSAGRPKLPPQKYLRSIPMCNREEGGRRIEHVALPLNLHYVLSFLSFLAPCLIIWWLSGQTSAVRMLGPIQVGWLYFVWLGLLIVLTLTEAWVLLRIWARLRKLLLALDRLPLRRTLLALKGMSWGTVWKMSGNVIEQRYRLISREKESLQHLENEVNFFWKEFKFDPKVDKTFVQPVRVLFTACDQAREAFDEWFARHYGHENQVTTQSTETPLNPVDLTAMHAFQEKLAETAGVVFLEVLEPAWAKEKRSLILDLSPSELEPHVRAAEEFFCLPYVGFIQNILGRIRTMTFSMMFLFVAATISVASYPFDPRPLLGGTFLALFAVISAIIIFVYAEIHRDPTLSYITNTDPGTLGADFWVKLIAFGIGPLVGLLSALFPEFTSFATSWLQPGVQAIK